MPPRDGRHKCTEAVPQGHGRRVRENRKGDPCCPVRGQGPSLSHSVKTRAANKEKRWWISRTLPSGRSRTALDPEPIRHLQPQASPDLDGRFPIGADSRHQAVQCHGVGVEFKQVDFGRAFVGFCFGNPCVTVAPGAAGKRHTEGHQRRIQTGESGHAPSPVRRLECLLKFPAKARGVGP